MLAVTNLLRVVRKRLSHDPELRDAYEERISDVIVDELGHITHNRTLLGAVGLVQTRMLLPLAAAALSSVSVELGPLNLIPKDARAELDDVFRAKRLPEHARKQAFIA